VDAHYLHLCKKRGKNMINNQVQKTMFTEHMFDDELLNIDFVINEISNYLLKSDKEKIIIDLFSDHKNIILGNDLKHLSKDNMIVLLDHMVKKGYLSKKEHGVFNTCPLCEAIIMKANCKDCGSNNISLNRKMIHTSCGHINEYHKFVTEKGLRCPSCGQIHSDIQMITNDTEYRFCDITQSCNDCGTEHKHYKRDERHQCPKCNKKIKIQNMSMHHILVYENLLK
jgi:hypothetical protein